MWKAQYDLGLKCSRRRLEKKDYTRHYRERRRLHHRFPLGKFFCDCQRKESSILKTHFSIVAVVPVHLSPVGKEFHHNRCGYTGDFYRRE